MKKILYLLLVASSIFSMQLDLVKPDTLQEKSSEYSYLNMDDVKKVRIQPSSVFVPEKLGSLELYHGNKGFSIRQDDKKFQIQKYFTDPLLRDVTREQLATFLQAGYLTINRMNDGEFSLKAKGRINGGGPILGSFMYWLTKSVCYGTAIGATGTIVVATGGTAVLAATGGTAAAGGLAIGSTIATTTAIGTTAGIITGGTTVAAAVSGGATVIGGAIAASTASEAAIVTAAAVTSAGGIAATIAAVETASVAVGTFFGMLPTP